MYLYQKIENFTNYKKKPSPNQERASNVLPEPIWLSDRNAFYTGF
ncbi:MAG: hypothetical protein PWQ54_317 [Bacteroidales bacterium]|jgi:hypothetical protein|nr:hypothetical protein [Bacteroidales bacterium]